MTLRTVPKSIDEYIAGFPGDIQALLQQIRLTIREAAPQAEEAISYQIPTFKLGGSPLVYFAAYKKHIGLYPIPKGTALKDQLSAYEAGKGTLRFPLDEPIPFDLIGKVVQYRAEEAAQKTQLRKR